MYTFRKYVLFALVLLFLPCPGQAQELQPDPYVYYPPEPRTSFPFYSPALGLRLNAGAFDRNDNPDLTNKGGGPSFGIEVNVFPEKTVSYRMDFMTVSTRYDANPVSSLGTMDDRMDLSTDAIIFGVRLSYPPERLIRIHTTAGIGYFRSQLTATGSLLGFPGEVNDTYASLGLDAGAGLEINIGNWVIGLDFRRWFLDKASFPTFGVNDANIGGNYFGFGIGWLFR